MPPTYRDISGDRPAGGYEQGLQEAGQGDDSDEKDVVHSEFS